MRFETAYLDEIPVAQWTPEQAYDHCLETWQANFRKFPDLFEPYIRILDDAETNEERLRIMRRSLAETFKQRWSE